MSEPKFTAPFSAGGPSVAVPASSSSPSAFASFVSPFTSLLDSFNATRERLNLPEPGKAEDLGREVKMTHLTQWTFDGARADLAKTFSHDPVFQVTHAFAAGSQGGPMGGVSPGTYNFSAAYAQGSKYLLQGNVDNEGSVSGRANYSWSPSNQTKIQASLPKSAGAQSMLLIEHDRLGKDYSLNVKAINPDLASDLSGTYDATYLQSVSPSLALGLQAISLRESPQQSTTSWGYIAKYHRVTKDAAGQPAAGSWIATAQALPQGMWQATYWKKLGERIDGGVDLTLIPSLIPRERRAIATAGVKYDFRQSTMRAQLDSQGKVSALLEHRLSPAFSFLVSGELDHKQNTSKFGVGIMLETADEEVMAAASQAQFPAAPPQM